MSKDAELANALKKFADKLYREGWPLSTLGDLYDAEARLRANDGERIEGCVTERDIKRWKDHGFLPHFYRNSKDPVSPTMPATLILHNPKESK